MGSTKETREIRDLRSTGTDAGTNAILARLDQLDQRMKDQNASLTKTLDEKVDQLRLDLKSDLQDELLPRITQNEVNITANTARIDHLENKLLHMENQMEMSSKSCDLIVRGVPVRAGEDVVRYYHRIATVLGIGTEYVPRADVFRLGRKVASSKYDPPILIKFLNKLDKSLFFNQYMANYNKLTLTALEFNIPSRFYISENLTKHNQKIHSVALKLWKDKKLYKVSTSFGYVYVKPKEKDTRVLINELSDLRKFGYNDD
jgi:hypothetical protein